MNDIKICVYINKMTAQGVDFESLKVIDGYATLGDIANNLLTSNKYIPSPGDKLFFIPGCDVPRFKLKSFCTKYKAALVKYKEKANALFIGPNSIKELIHRLAGISYSRVEFSAYLNKTVKGLAQYKDLLTAIEGADSEYVVVDYDTKSFLEKNTLGRPFTLEGVYNAPIMRFKDEKSYQQFIDILANKNIFSQDEILKRINSGAVMGEKEFHSIKRMLKSTDKENIKLAMETMANCDYEKSCVSLLLLMKEFGLQLFESSTRNHVNFKSLLKFFDISDVQNVDLNDVITALLKRKLLNKINLDILVPMAIAEMKEKAQLRYFSPTAVILDEDIVNGLKDNILDSVCDTEIVEDPKEQLNPQLSLVSQG